MKNNDLTVGNPRKVLWKFCLPLFGSVIFQQMYNVADSLVVGKVNGETALAAVGNSYELTLIYLSFAFGCNIGCSVLTARLFGAGNYRDMKTSVYTAMVACGVLCGALMGIGFCGGEALLVLIRTPEEVMADSLLYFRIYTLGLPFLFFYNLSTGIFSALGDSKTPFLFLAVSSVSNILMDILFVCSFQMGVAGVAWATFLCQGGSCLAALWVIIRRLHQIPAGEKIPKFSCALLGEFAAIAIPSTLQQCFVSVGNIIIQGVVNSFGASVMAGYSAAIKLNNLVITSFNTLGTGMSNYTAQNMGAKKEERIRKGFFCGVRMVWMLAIPFVLIYVFFGKYLLLMFMNAESAEALDVGMKFLRIVSPFYFFVAAKITADGVLRGAGHMASFMSATFFDLFLRVVLSVLFSRWLQSSVGIWLSWPIGWVLSSGLSAFFLWLCLYRKKKPDCESVHSDTDSLL